MSEPSAEQYLTISEVAEILRVSPTKVVGWIRRAELPAIDVGNGGSRPRYRISQDSLQAFIEARAVQPPPRQSPRKQLPPEGGPLDPVLGEKLLKKGQAKKVGDRYFRVWNGMTLYV